MLQQTQVPRVAPKYKSFMTRFPTVQSLAEASTAEVIREWSGLGYNRRAVNLHRLARAVVQEHDGRLPDNAAALRRLPGIGDYTARAVASIAFGERTAPVDTNVRRVLTRVVDGPESDRTAGQMQALADAALARERPGDWNEALMELGACICLPAPQCGTCPVRTVCATAPVAHQVRERRVAYHAAKPAQRYHGTRRFYRGRIVEMLRTAGDGEALTVDEVGARLRLDYAEADREWIVGLLQGVARDHLIVFEDGTAALPQ
ncbi:MAG: A/G-specific adenine glycosylase [Dehalococcoidia bacterium]